jgi:ribonuclease P protein component
MTGRITRAQDFERVLKTSSQARSPHFAVHHLASVPSVPKKPAAKLASTELSTSGAAIGVNPVDDIVSGVPAKAAVHGVWLGMVVPKRHAKRAVTRTLLKRQIKAVMDLQEPVPPGLWVVRLRAPFDRTVYVSAASKALSAVAREELTRVLHMAAQRLLAA